MMTKNIGLSSTERQKTTQKLEVFLANTFIIYTKTLNFHWNVVGDNFIGLHTLFQEQYESLALSVDEIAERIRVLGFKAPGSLADFLRLTTLQEEKKDLDAREMLQHLISDYGTLIAHIRETLAEIDEQDIGSRALLEEQLSAHEKTIWILDSHLKK